VLVDVECVAQVRCVRAEMASRVELQPTSPSLTFYPYKQRPALGGWIADERSSTFVVVSHDGTPQQLEGVQTQGGGGGAGMAAKAKADSKSSHQVSIMQSPVVLAEQCTCSCVCAGLCGCSQLFW